MERRWAIHYQLVLKPVCNVFCAFLQAEQLTGLLLNAGAAANTKDSENGATPLHDAVTTGHVEVVKVLLEHGADPSVEAHNVH